MNTIWGRGAWAAATLQQTQTVRTAVRTGHGCIGSPSRAGDQKTHEVVLEGIIEPSKDGSSLTTKADIDLCHQLRRDHQAEPHPSDGLDIFCAQLRPGMKDLAGFGKEGELEMRAYILVCEGKGS